jgi:hypothetical protein
MPLVLDGGNALRFGQKIEEAESLFSCHAIDNPARVARKRIDEIINTANLQLDFDSGRLCRVTFAVDYQFDNPPTPYEEDWKNFPEIDSGRVFGRMSREKFLSYLSKWEQRAISMGAEKVDMGDLTREQFAVSICRDSFWDAVCVNMGPSRRAGGGGIWCDGWIATFEKPKTKFDAGILESLSAFRDEFNTVARQR